MRERLALTSEAARQATTGRPLLLAGLLSLGLHGASLAGLLWWIEVEPPNALPMMVVEVVGPATDAEDAGEAFSSASEPRSASKSGAPEAPADTRPANAFTPLSVLEPVPAPAPDPVPASDPVRQQAQRPAPASESQSGPPPEPEPSPEATLAVEAPPPKPPPPKPPAPQQPEKSAATESATAPPRTERRSGDANPGPAAPGAQQAALPDPTRGAGGGGAAERAPRFSGQGLANPAPEYPFAARRRGQEGRVVLRVRVTPEGEAAVVKVARSSGYKLLDQAALDAVGRWRFHPAERHGQAVAGIVEVPVLFKLER